MGPQALKDETSSSIRDKPGNRNADRIEQGFKAGRAGFSRKPADQTKNYFQLQANSKERIISYI
jgi:hypothetical protein